MPITPAETHLLEDIRKGSADKIKSHVIQYDINVNALIGIELPLEVAVNTGKLECVKSLINLGANPNKTGQRTPLICCILRNDINMARYLIEMGANTCQPDNNDRTPLAWVVLTSTLVENDQQMLDLLLHNNAEFSIHSALVEAVNIRNLDKLKILMEKCPEAQSVLNILDRNKETLFIRAVRIASAPTINYLIEMKVDVNKKNMKGECALSVALQNCDFATFKLVFEGGANVQFANPSISSMARQNPVFASYLLKRPATKDS